MIERRRLLFLSAAALLPVPRAHAQRIRSLDDPLRVGADLALADSGLAKQLWQSFGRDTGLAVQLVPGPALPMLDALERGELDAALSNAPGAEERLVALGLAYDRQAIAGGEFVIVGPAPKHRQTDPAGIAGGHDAVEALGRLRATAQTFLSAADGSGAHVVEQALWRDARIAPQPPWYVAADAHAGLIAQARTRAAYALVERGAWLAQGGAPLAVLVDGDPRMQETVHVLRSFRSNHPAAKLFVEWIAGPKGRRLVAAHRGYRTGQA